MAGKVGTGQACAACKFQRRKCAPDCPLAPYFPPDQPKQFLNAHKLFGVSNILRILKQVNDSQKSDAMKSIIFQANAREKDPVHGCYGIIVDLRTKIQILEKELLTTRNQICLIEQFYQSRDFCNYAPQKQVLNQQQQEEEDFGIDNQASHALPPSWMSPGYVESPYAVTAAAAAAAGSFQAFEPKPVNNISMKPERMLDYEARNSYCDSKEAYESSAESSMKDTQSLDHFADLELKNAAALFTLTNQN